MGFFNWLEGVFTKAEAESYNSKNLQAAASRSEARRKNFLASLEPLGDIIIAKGDGDFKESLGYKIASFGEDYSTKKVNEDWVTTSVGYSGTIDSSGNVEIHRDVDGYTNYTTEDDKEHHYDTIEYKVVQKGKKSEVKKLEKKFWRKGGKCYFKYLYTDSDKDLKNLKTYTIYQVIVAVFAIIATALFVYGYIDRDFFYAALDTDGTNLVTLFSRIVFIALLVISIISLFCSFRDSSRDILGIILTIIIEAICLYNCYLNGQALENPKDNALIFYGITALFSLIVIIRGIRNNKILSSSKKQEFFEGLIGEILSYNVKF